MNKVGVVDRIYDVLVNRVPGIREKYKKKREQTQGRRSYKAWLYLAYLNISYHIFRCRDIGVMKEYPHYERKTLYTGGSESSLSRRCDPEQFARELADFDVVSIDVFDTLIFRPFSEPADLFYFIGHELGYMDFKRIRMEMERKAREKKYRQEKHYEVSLTEIYALLAYETGIEADRAADIEIQTEYNFCRANPYMKRVVEQLRRLKKRIIITSDMYLPTSCIQTLLEKCGYAPFDAYYVSCDVGKSKSRGDLYDEVRICEKRIFQKGFKGKMRAPKKKMTFVHVGDNPVSDVVNARDKGFEVRHYVNVNDAGSPFRPLDMSCITGGIYRGLVNMHIHNGLYQYSREYEFGYIYGGLFVTGYCQFIHEYVHKNGIDTILFLARDGYILRQAYVRMFPEDECMCRYAYWSRLAATKMAASYFKYDYFRRFLYHKVDQGYRIRDILESMELTDMLPELTKCTELSGNAELTHKNVNVLKGFLIERWAEVLSYYEQQLEAGKQYFSTLIKRGQKVLAIDIGWAGSGAITLAHIVNHIWKIGCEITGMIAGTNTAANAEPDASDTFLQSGNLVSYMYSQRENRDIWKFHDPGKGHNLYWEALLDAPHGTLRGFYPTDNAYEIVLKNNSVNREGITDVQSGVLDFVDIYRSFMGKTKLLEQIAGRDAYAPMLLAENMEGAEFFKAMQHLTDDANVG